MPADDAVSQLSDHATDDQPGVPRVDDSCGYFLYETDWTGFAEGSRRFIRRDGKAKPPRTVKTWFRTRAEADRAKVAARQVNSSPDLVLTVRTAPPPQSKALLLLDNLPAMTKRLTE